MLVTLRAGYHVGRITKKGGSIIVVEYDISHGENSPYDCSRNETEKEMWRIFGAKLIKAKFFENEAVWSDTRAASEEDPESRNAKKGYRLLVMRKKC